LNFQLFVVLFNIMNETTPTLSSEKAKADINKRMNNASRFAGLMACAGIAMGYGSFAENGGVSIPMLFTGMVGVPTTIWLTNRRSEKICERIVRDYASEKNVPGLGHLAPASAVNDEQPNESLVYDPQTFSFRSPGVVLTGASVIAGVLTRSLVEGSVTPGAVALSGGLTAATYTLSIVGLAANTAHNLGAAEAYCQRISNIDGINSGTTLQ
jgi:TctA family transporter